MTPQADNSHPLTAHVESRPAFGVVIIGDEILSGKRADKHLPKMIELLGARGLQLGWAEYVGDDPARITQVLQRAFASGDVVFSCGGIAFSSPWSLRRGCSLVAWLLTGFWFMLWASAVVGVISVGLRGGQAFGLTRRELKQDWQDIKEQLP